MPHFLCLPGALKTCYRELLHRHAPRCCCCCCCRRFSHEGCCWRGVRNRPSKTHAPRFFTARCILKRDNRQLRPTRGDATLEARRTTLGDAPVEHPTRVLASNHNRRPPPESGVAQHFACMTRNGCHATPPLLNKRDESRGRPGPPSPPCSCVFAWPWARAAGDRDRPTMKSISSQKCGVGGQGCALHKRPHHPENPTFAENGVRESLTTRNLAMQLLGRLAPQTSEVSVCVVLLFLVLLRKREKLKFHPCRMARWRYLVAEESDRSPTV